MALNFTDAEHASTVSGVKCLVYSGSGAGKTVLMATAPAPVMISAEAGALSLRKANLERIFGVGHPSITYNMPMIVVQNTDDIADAYRWCLQSNEARQFQTVGMDSISEIMEQILNNAKRQVKDPRQAYGELIEKGQTMVRSFRDLPNKNVIISAKMEPMKDELSGVTKYGPSVPGSKLGPSLPYFFDEVFHLGINKDTQGQDFRYLRTQPDLQYEAKDRSGALLPIEFPHLGAIFAKILSA